MAADGLTQHGLELFRGHPARVAEVDFVVFAVEGQVVGWHELEVEAVQNGRFVVVGAGVHDLGGQPLVVGCQPQQGQRR